MRDESYAFNNIYDLWLSILIRGGHDCYLSSLFLFFVQTFERENRTVARKIKNAQPPLRCLAENKYSNLRRHSRTIILNNMLTFDFFEKT